MAYTPQEMAVKSAKISARGINSAEDKNLTILNLEWSQATRSLEYCFGVGKRELIYPIKATYAKSIQYSDLLRFLWEDKTDQEPYGKFLCHDFALTLHNKAQKNGILCYFVALSLSSGDHTLTAFSTKDRGLVYIDSTSPKEGIRGDKQVEVAIGGLYKPKLLQDYGYEVPDMGIIQRIIGVI